MSDEPTHILSLPRGPMTIRLARRRSRLTISMVIKCESGGPDTVLAETYTSIYDVRFEGSRLFAGSRGSATRAGIFIRTCAERVLLADFCGFEDVEEAYGRPDGGQ